MRPFPSKEGIPFLNSPLFRTTIQMVLFSLKMPKVKKIFKKFLEDELIDEHSLMENSEILFTLGILREMSRSHYSRSKN